MGADRDDVFKAWMEAHLGVLHRISRAFAAGADQHDLMQELMLAVWRAAPLFRGESDENAFARLRIKIIAGSYFVVVPVLVWLILQLGDVGKMEPRHQEQMGIIFGAALSASAAYLAYKYFSQLAPERRRLEALLRQYDQTDV